MSLNYYARSTDPETSQAAAEELEVAGYWARVVQFLASHDRPEGWTAYEIDQALPGKLGLCSWHRVSDVRRKGWASWAVDSEGRNITRPGESTRRQGASRITPEGREWLRAAPPEGRRGRPRSPEVGRRRDSLVTSLRTDGPQTARDLADRLALDPVTVHQDLQTLLRESRVQSRVGNPTVWEVPRCP